jgi:hypothetical protein
MAVWGDGSVAACKRETNSLSRIIRPQYVKPYVKRGKNDRNDAGAACEASMRLIPFQGAR